MGFTYKRCSDSDKDLEQGDFESESELNTPIPDLSAYLSSLEQQQEQQEQQNKTQSRWKRLIEYDPDGFWNVKPSELGCWFISFIMIVFVSTMIFMGIVLDHAAAPGRDYY